MASLILFADELLHHVFAELHPLDIAAISQTCQRFSCYIRNNHLLWKDVFSRHYDVPSEKLSAQIHTADYYTNEVHRRIRLQKLLQSSDISMKRNSLNSVSETVLSLLSQASPDQCSSKNLQFLRHYFCDPQHLRQNADVFLFSSSLYDNAGSSDNIPASTYNGQQLSAQMHSLFGVSIEANARTRSHSTHCFARSKVYDLREYSAALNKWGPFKHDGKCGVDWEKVEAIMIVLGHNMQQFSIRSNGLFPMVWDRPFEGAYPETYLAQERPGPLDEYFEKPSLFRLPKLEAQPEPPLDAMDPYGVTGTWMRVVCFLDYSDFYAFNFANSRDDEGPRHPIDTQEAIRLIIMKIRVTRIEEPGKDDGQDLPVIHFSGTSRSMHSSWDPNANSLLEGCDPECLQMILSIH